MRCLCQLRSSGQQPQLCHRHRLTSATSSVQDEVVFLYQHAPSHLLICVARSPVFLRVSAKKVFFLKKIKPGIFSKKKILLSRIDAFNSFNISQN